MSTGEDHDKCEDVVIDDDVHRKRSGTYDCLY